MAREGEGDRRDQGKKTMKERHGRGNQAPKYTQPIHPPSTHSLGILLPSPGNKPIDKVMTPTGPLMRLHRTLDI